MIESLGNYFLDKQGLKAGPDSTSTIAADLVISGVPPSQAYVQAAQIFREQEKTNIERQKHEQKQQQLAVASKILQEGGSLADLLAAGVDNPAILGALPQSQWVPNIHHPEGGEFRNPGTRGMQQPGVGGGGMPGPQNNMMPPQQASQQNISTGNRMPMASPGLGNTTPAEKQATIDVQKRRIEETDKWQKELNDQANNASDVITNIGRVKRAIPKMFTGTGANLKYEGSKATGIFKESTVATEKFNAAVSQVINDLEAQKKRGATDAARDIIIATKPYLENTEEGSASIANAIDAHAKGQKEKAKAAHEWLKSGGNKEEFDIKWREFEEAHPFITENEKNGLLEVHEENIHKWKDILFGKPQSEEKKENPFMQEMQKRGFL